MIEEKEEWRDIPGYENLYQISTMGRVKSIERKAKNRNGYRTVSERILKPFKNRYGYFSVKLCKEIEKKTIQVHKIVCDVFLPNPLNLPQVNHRNEDKSDNRLENLEWCDAKYNVNYGTRTERVSKKLKGVFNTKNSKAVKCLETGKIYPSLMEIQRNLGFHNSHISKCCNNKLNSAYGYHWQYV